MRSSVQIAYYALWISHPVLHLTVIAAMARRKLYRLFPAFLIYNIYQILAFAVLFPISLRGSYTAYFFAYWVHAALGLALGFMVIHEVFLDVFRPYHTLKDLGTMIFKWAALVMLVVAGVVAAASAASEQGPLVQSVLTVQRCVRIIQFGLVLFLLLFSRYLGISRKQKSFGIALGFGMYAAVDLLSVSLRASGYITEETLNLTLLASFLAVMLVWLGYMGSRQEARRSISVLLASQRWEQSLTDIHHPLASDSLIPMFENMVEHAFCNPDSADEIDLNTVSLAPPSTTPISTPQHPGTD